MRHPQHLGLGHDPRRHLTAAPAFGPLAATLQPRRVLHPAWFDRWPALETLQPGDLVALRQHDLLQFRYLAQQFHKPSFQLGTREVGKIGGRWHATTKSYPPASGQARKSRLPRGYAPITTLGHPVGDALLQVVAERLGQHARETDTVARLGGDEFAIILEPIEKPTEAIRVANRVLGLFDAPFEVAGHQIVIGTSIGIAFAPEDGTDDDQLLKNADLALYRAKVDGRGVYRLFQPEMDAQMQARRLLELDLRKALRTGQFELFYQPLVDMRAGAVTGFEALLRWRHPERGLVAPGEFIPLAEEMGLIVPIGEWVLAEACATAAGWPGGMRVAVNLSPAQFKSCNLVTAVSRALRDAELRADRLELEITETVMLQDTEATLATLHQLHDLGAGIALDDFGTGYSSLSYLRRFPFDRIKIDQSFVRELGIRRDCGAIVRAVAGLSRDLGMATTVEGVETREQLALLRSAGCTEFQGYLFSPAVPGTDVADLVGRIGEMLRLPAEALAPALAE